MESWYGMLGIWVSKEEDKLRDIEIEECGISVYHVKEQDYYDNLDKVVLGCLDFREE